MTVLIENPWKMRFLHHGFAHIELDWRGHKLHFDPIVPPADNEMVVLTWNWMSRLKGTLSALQERKKLKIIAPPEALDWLRQFGDFEAYPLGASMDGLDVSLYPYSPLNPSSGHERWSQIKSVMKRPRRALGRLRDRIEVPNFLPVIAHLQFPSGAQLLHLNLAIHEQADFAWKQKMLDKFTGCDWLISGCDYQNDRVVIEDLPLFAPKHLLLADLIGDSRKGLGLPTQLLTPIVDTLSSKGVDAHPFAPFASYRFDNIPIEAV